MRRVPVLFLPTCHASNSLSGFTSWHIPHSLTFGGSNPPFIPGTPPLTATAIPVFPSAVPAHLALIFRSSRVARLAPRRAPPAVAGHAIATGGGGRAGSPRGPTSTKIAVAPGIGFPSAVDGAGNARRPLSSSRKRLLCVL